MAVGLTVVASREPVGPRGVIAVPSRDRVAPTIRHSTKATDDSHTIELHVVGPNRPSALRISVNSIGTFVVGFVFSLTFIAVVPAVWGFDSVVVASGSMTPALQTGDVVVTRGPPGPLAPGSVIKFDADGQSVIHRIAAVDGDQYRTKGDANEKPDSGLVHRQEVDGVGVLLVPFIGNPVVWLEQGNWVRLGLAIAVVLTALWVSPRQWLNFGTSSRRAR